LQVPAPKALRSLARWRKRIADQIRSAVAHAKQNKAEGTPTRLR
jgi:hypothetical protein